MYRVVCSILALACVKDGKKEKMENMPFDQKANYALMEMIRDKLKTLFVHKAIEWFSSVVAWKAAKMFLGN